MSLHSIIDDPASPLLRDLKHSVLGLQKVSPLRLLGDGATIDGAILALTIVRNRIDEATLERVALAVAAE